MLDWLFVLASAADAQPGSITLRKADQQRDTNGTLPYYYQGDVVELENLDDGTREGQFQ
ncbi:hypothetical protein OK016_29725 [Vibrio chagasii]|nr:hypothetical protein [Vibrio chagasii]